jgi:hypothetical protein
MRYAIRKGRDDLYELVSIVQTNFGGDAINFIYEGTYEQCKYKMDMLMYHSKDDKEPIKKKHESDPERIYLQPICCIAPYEDRQWCEKDIWQNEFDDCEESGVEYVRADLLTQAQLRIELLEQALIRERAELLWAAYHDGFEIAGKWSTQGKISCEWLVQQLGLDATIGTYDAQLIKQSIPLAAKEVVKEATD